MQGSVRAVIAAEIITVLIEHKIGHGQYNAVFTFFLKHSFWYCSTEILETLPQIADAGCNDCRNWNCHFWAYGQNTVKYLPHLKRLNWEYCIAERVRTCSVVDWQWRTSWLTKTYSILHGQNCVRAGNSHCIVDCALPGSIFYFVFMLYMFSDMRWYFFSWLMYMHQIATAAHFLILITFVYIALCVKHLPCYFWISLWKINHLRIWVTHSSQNTTSGTGSD